MGVHRTCQGCGADWNVSRIAPGPDPYICPVCDLRAKLKQRKK